ncbi:MAG: aldo/keto reductase [Bacteroidetes bacterium]|nr:aldo/keto reductase [Bacteroidota bacterium]MBS1973823.1 aldo/keto reductase [Bacteroidota bacterium]
MKYRKLGRSGLSVSAIGFGCMSLHQDNEANKNIICEAIDRGINFFDTADIYDNGENEAMLGKAVRKHRDKVIIATKVGNKLRKDGPGLDWDATKPHILASVEQSLKRLKTDRIDIYQLHGGTLDDDINEAIDAFEILKKQGKIRFYGISSIRPNVIREWVKKSGIISVMMQYSLLDRRPEEACLELLAANNIGVLARGSIAKGLLAGKPSEHYLDHDASEVNKASTAVALLANNKRTAAQTALQFVLHENAVSSAIVGIRTKQQLNEAIQTISAPEITEDELGYLKHILLPNRYELHR